jgi:hypothetical protein
MDIAACPEELGCFVYLNDGKGHFGSGIQIQAPGAVPYSMIAADLNRDHRPEIIVGYVNAPGVFISTTALERNISLCHSGMARERSMAWRQAIWTGTVGRMSWRRDRTRPVL